MTETSTLESQLDLWRGQQAQRRGLNDDFQARRPVEHVAYFRRRAFANVAGAQLRSQGFTVTINRKGLDTLLQATREDSLDPASVEGFLSDVIAVVERSQGAYDGWRAAVETSSERHTTT